MRGLTQQEAAARLARVGPNALPAAVPDPPWRRFLRQFRSPLIAILVVALGFDAALWAYEGAEGLPIEAIAIAVILLLNAALGLYQEQRSEAALARLTAMAAAQSWVMREGYLVRLPSADLVPGDCVRLEAGDRVPADGTLVEAAGALFDESVLTGESAPVDRPMGEEAQSGTLLVRGRVLVEVSRTGPASSMGKLASMLGGIRRTPTPLERRVDALGRDIAKWVLALADYARISFTEGRPIVDASRDLMRRIHADFRYEPKATSVDTPLIEAFRSRRGVCQDFAHVMVGALRSIGLAARYVSGYLRSGALVGAEASHAWVAVCVPGSGWLELDPTNNVRPGIGHVTLAWGRDYGDVTPVKGIALGGGQQIVEVEVRVEPV